MWRFLIRLLQLPLALIVMFYEWVGRRSGMSRLAGLATVVEGDGRRDPTPAAVGCVALLFALPSLLLFPVKVVGAMAHCARPARARRYRDPRRQDRRVAVVARLFTLTPTSPDAAARLVCGRLSLVHPVERRVAQRDPRQLAPACGSSHQVPREAGCRGYLARRRAVGTHHFSAFLTARHLRRAASLKLVDDLSAPCQAQ